MVGTTEQPRCPSLTVGSYHAHPDRTFPNTKFCLYNDNLWCPRGFHIKQADHVALVSSHYPRRGGLICWQRLSSVVGGLLGLTEVHVLVQEIGKS